MYSDGNVFKIRGVCFTVLYLMTTQSLSSTLKLNREYILDMSLLKTVSLQIQPLVRSRIIQETLTWFMHVVSLVLVKSENLIGM